MPPRNKMILARRLAENGVAPEIISASLDVPVAQLRLQRTFLTPEDQALAEGVRQIGWRAIAETLDIYERGNAHARLEITKTIIGKIGGLVGQESTSSFEDAQQAVGRIFEAMRVDAGSALPALPVPPAPQVDGDGQGSNLFDDEPLPDRGLDPWSE